MRDYVSELKVKSPHIEITTKAQSGHDKVGCLCKVCGYLWSSRPYDLLRGHGCHQCGKVKRYNSDTFRVKLHELHPNLVAVDEYTNARTKMSIYCKKCETTFQATSNSLFTGHGCRTCAIKKNSNRQTKAHTTFVSEVYKLTSGEYKVLGKYQGTEVPVLIVHQHCKTEFESRPSNFLRGTRCPHCNGGMRKKTTEYFRRELMEATENEYDVVGKYSRNNIPIKIVHKECGHVFLCTPSSMLYQGTRCPKCFFSSKGEYEVRKWLTENNFVFEEQKTFESLPKMRFDFYLPQQNICIEYDGRQHFEPVEIFGGEEEFKKTKARDEIKDDYCKSKGICLIRIPYTTNIERALEGLKDV